MIWLGLGLAIAYALDVPWRLWRKRPLRFGTLWGELLLPALFLMQLDRNPLRLLTTAIVCVAALHRIVVRKRLGVPA